MKLTSWQKQVSLTILVGITWLAEFIFAFTFLLSMTDPVHPYSLPLLFATLELFCVELRADIPSWFVSGT